MKRHIAALAVLCTLTTALCAQDYDKVTIKSTKLTDHIYTLEGAGGNMGVSVGEDGILLIDDEFAPLSDKIRAALKKLGGDSPRYLLNTHWHGDHTGGNAAFGKTGSIIIAQDNVRKRLMTPQKLFGRTVEPLPKVGLPVITYEDSLSIHFNGEEIRVQHLPSAHTDGDSVIFFTKSNVVHMGDLLFNEMFPFVDLDHGGDVEGVARDVQTVLNQLKPGAKIIAGHGPTTDAAGLKRYHRMLVECIDAVRKQIAAGKSLEEIQSAGVPKQWESWGNGFIKTDRWIATIYQSLTRK